MKTIMRILFSKPGMIGGLMVLAALILSTSHLEAQTSKNNATATKGDGTRTPAASKSVAGRSRKDDNSFSPQGTGSAVKGTGTAGMIPKWLDSTTIGDSIISEAAGKVGIGTTTPGSKLSVAGMIETTMGGYKFPDGTLQSTAGLASVTHNTTLSGDGTTGSPLKIAVPLGLGATLQSSSTLVVHNSGSGGAIFAMGGIISNGNNATTTIAGGAFSGLAGSSDSGDGGGGMSVAGGSSNSGHGGTGVFGWGGNSVSNVAGAGVTGRGGNSSSSAGGTGVSGSGGNSNLGDGGPGFAGGGGQGNGPGHTGGDGLRGFAGQGVNGATPGYAGIFFGDVYVGGNLTKNAGSFKIDHPLYPESKYLYHSFVESPDMMNIYNGNVTLDGNGEAVVDLPDWYSALNRDARYLLTAIGAPGPSLYIAQKIANNRFKIAGGQPGMEVSWQVTGIRQDVWANKHRIPVEEPKSDIEQGHYLHPELFNQPEEQSIEWARNPELMRRMKQEREQMRQRKQ
jgi:hypothetical protein